MSEPRIVCIVARQRSGTTALQANLAATGRIENFGEIFHTDNLDKPGSFFGYCRDHRVLLSDVMIAPELARLVQRYFAHLRKMAGEQHVLIDVKYNSWGALHPAWSYPQEQPFLMSVLKKMEALFIFVQRRDLAAQIVSGHIARANDQWQNLSAASHKPLELDLRQMKREARRICLAEAFLLRSLGTYKQVLRLTYETLYADGGVAPEAQRQISTLLGETLRFPAQSPIRKSLVEKSESVLNYTEIKKAVERIAKKARRESAI